MGNFWSKFKNNKVVPEDSQRLILFDDFEERINKLEEDMNSKYTRIVNMYNFLRKEKFDYAIILGDRYEALATALACFFSSIKIIHIGGGSITIGSLDQIYRNCISQLSKI